MMAACLSLCVERSTTKLLTNGASREGEMHSLSAFQSITHYFGSFISSSAFNAPG